MASSGLSLSKFVALIVFVDELSFVLVVVISPGGVWFLNLDGL